MGGNQQKDMNDSYADWHLRTLDWLKANRDQIRSECNRGDETCVMIVYLATTPGRTTARYVPMWEKLISDFEEKFGG